MSPAEQVIAGVYAWSGPLSSLAYVPQIVTLWRTHDKASSTSLLTWFMWLVSLGITTAYALLVNRDRAFVLTSVCNFAGCALVFFLAAYKRWSRSGV